MQHKFSVGDRVRLISGGPVMTVFSTGDDIVLAMWMDEQQHLHRDSFNREVLNKVTALSEVQTNG
jgi:uncharacterized protein YodC (DUF2158 family)